MLVLMIKKRKKNENKGADALEWRIYKPSPAAIPPPAASPPRHEPGRPRHEPAEAQLARPPREAGCARGALRVGRDAPGLKDSVAERPNHSNLCTSDHIRFRSKFCPKKS